jgi:hypothetical protein
MIPKKTPQQILLENASFIKVNQSYINAILIAKLQDFVEIKTTFCSPIEDIKKTTLEVSIKHVKKIISKISISNDDIIAHLNYDGVTKRLCDFDIEIASIKRDVLVNLWKKSIKKVGALSDN